MTWHDYVIGKLMWEVVLPLGIIVSIFVIAVIWLAFSELVIRPLYKYFRKLK